MNKIQQSLREYVDKMVDFRREYINDDHMYVRLQKDGQFFTPLKHRPPQYPLMKIRDCFRNAYIMLQKPELEYVEGIAYSGIMPVHHAWNVDKDGNVVDVTWRTRGKLSKFGEGREYFGIIIPRDVLDKALYAVKPYTYGYWKSDL